MRIVKSGDMELKIRGRNTALVFFYQEFGEELTDAVIGLVVQIGAWINMLDGKNPNIQLNSRDVKNIDFERLNREGAIAPSRDLLRICWAMAKAQAYADGVSLPGFLDWVQQTEGVDVRDIQVGVLEEAVDGFFRRGKEHEQ